MKTTKRFTIDRREWLRGEGPRVSFLLRPEDNKRCCVGIYLRASGVSDGELRGRCSVEDVRDTIGSDHWLIADADTLCQINDYRFSPEAERETKIEAVFARHGVTVRFKDDGRQP